MDQNLLHGRYKILSKLGSGSFAVVYLACDMQKHGSMVAIKAISTKGFSEEEYRDLNSQFLQEAAFLMELSHPCLPEMWEYFADGSCYYFVMEWIAGKTMTQMVEDNGLVSQTQALDWGIELCSILDYLHSRKPYPIILGDLKPSNVMITFEGKVKIIDFGVARYLAPSQNPRTFALVSPGFAPPEKFVRFDCDLRGDIYSLGATLYWTLTKARLERMNFDIPPLRKFRPEANHWFEEVLAKCMSYDPNRRYDSVTQVRNELLAVKKELQGRQERAREQSSNLLGELYKKKYRGDDLL